MDWTKNTVTRMCFISPSLHYKTMHHWELIPPLFICFKAPIEENKKCYHGITRYILPNEKICRWYLSFPNYLAGIIIYIKYFFILFLLLQRTLWMGPYFLMHGTLLLWSIASKHYLYFPRLWILSLFLSLLLIQF